MKGYLNYPEGTKEAFSDEGWFRSGDIGLFDEDGYLYTVDRLKDMIITGGENVFSRKVEEVLCSRVEVQECAVICLPDKEWGEWVTAFIISRPAVEAWTKDHPKGSALIRTYKEEIARVRAGN